MFVLLFICCSAFAQTAVKHLNNEYSIELLTAEDGFTSSEIYSIIQDNKGLLWFGTGENGILKYDGRKVVNYEYDDNQANGISHNDAGNLLLADNGDIWIGTWGGGASHLDIRTGLFNHFEHDEQRHNSISSNRIQSLFDDKGTIWMGSYAHGLNKYLGDNTFKRYLHTQHNPATISHNRVWDIEENNSNSLWIATSYGLNLFDKETEKFINFLPEPQNTTPTGANEIRNLLKTDAGLLYVGTQVGLFQFDVKSEHFLTITTAEQKLLGQVNSIIEDQEGSIWIVSSKGLFRLGQNQQLYQLQLPHNNGLRIVFEDRSGIIWVTSEVHGIYKITPQRKFKNIRSDLLLAPNGITVDEQGDLLIVSASSVLYKWSVKSQRLLQLTEQIFTKAQGFSENRLLERPVLHLADKNTLWVAQDDGLASVDLQSNTVSLLRYPKSEPLHKEFRELRALNSDQYGNIWVGTYKSGIYIYDVSKKTFRHLGHTAGLTHPEVLEIYKDRENNIWVGTGDGVSLWREGSQSFTQFKQNSTRSGSLVGKIVQDIHQSRDGKIWVATQKGLNLFDEHSQTFSHFGRQDGLPTSLIRAIEDDDMGNVWLTTNKGISMLNPESNYLVNYDGYDGLLGINYYANSLIKGANNLLFTNSQRGIEYFSTEILDDNNRQFHIVLTGFSKMGQEVSLDKPFAYVDEIALSYLDYFISFEFSVLDFSSPSKNQYAYKLQGYDENWIEIGNRNVAAFTNLDGGYYTLLVKATDSHGKWLDKQLSIRLYVAPPPWQTWWAYCLYALFALIIISAIIVYRTRSQENEIMRQKQFVQALEEQVAEKTSSLNAQAQDLLIANKQLELLTFQDGLTGLYNRRYFDQHLFEEVKRHSREQQDLSLIFCDIDHFKLYNDHYGHLAGDNCLKQVAQCLRQCVGRITDSCCRYGGEEFAIILPNTNEEQSNYLAEQLRLAVEAMKVPHEKSATSAFITMTLGVVTLTPTDNTSVDSVILSADKALYIGKAEGRNRTSRANAITLN